MTNHIKENKIITLIPSDNLDDKYIIEKDKEVIINIISIDKSIKLDIELEENSKLDLITGIINNKNCELYIDIKHQSNSKSNVINHLLNVNDGIANIDINAYVEKGKLNCVLNQDNKIINVKNGKCNIKPNLLINEFTSFANHSAYISKFKKEDIFYLMSRGINKKGAMQMLTKSFLLSNMKLNDQDKSFFIEKIENIGKED